MKKKVPIYSLCKYHEDRVIEKFLGRPILLVQLEVSLTLSAVCLLFCCCYASFWRILLEDALF